MRVAVVDVGSNTARLLVADVDRRGSVVAVEEQREHLGLGAEIATTGALSPSTVAEVAELCARYARCARRLGSERGEAIVTAPGRQGRSPGELAAALARATALPVRVLSAEEEGRLAFEGAVSRVRGDRPDLLAVVDVGGGSTEIVVGTRDDGGEWVHSLDLGSLRLTTRAFGADPPSRPELKVARKLVRAALAGVTPPRADRALAAGGTARAVAKLVGPSFSADDLDDVVRTMRRRPSADVAREAGIHPVRAGTLLAGAVVLSETARLLDRPLELARGGLREGAALALASVAVEEAA